MAGACPTADEVRRLRERHPDLFDKEPTLRARLDDRLPISYTQWEFYLACHHRTQRLVYLAAPEAPRSPRLARLEDQLASQQLHLQTLKTLGEHRDSFVSQDNLCRKVIIALTRHRLIYDTTEEAASDANLNAARDSMPAIVRDIHDRINKPDPRAVPVQSTSGADILLHALQTVAKARGLSTQDLIALLDRHLAEKRDEADQKRSSASLYDLAFAQLALGDYEQAMQTAADAAQLAEKALESDSARTEEHRLTALDAYLLLSHVGKSAHQFGPALDALRKGASLIDKNRDPRILG